MGPPRHFDHSPTADAPVVGAHEYRSHFKSHGEATLAASWDLRRAVTWAPYAVVPSAYIASKLVKRDHRVRVWIGTLVSYGIVSVVMYNTDSSSD